MRFGARTKHNLSKDERRIKLLIRPNVVGEYIEFFLHFTPFLLACFLIVLSS